MFKILMGFVLILITAYSTCSRVHSKIKTDGWLSNLINQNKLQTQFSVHTPSLLCTAMTGE